MPASPLEPPKSHLAPRRAVLSPAFVVHAIAATATCIGCAHVGPAAEGTVDLAAAGGEGGPDRFVMSGDASELRLEILDDGARCTFEIRARWYEGEDRVRLAVTVDVGDIGAALEGRRATVPATATKPIVNGSTLTIARESSDTTRDTFWYSDGGSLVVDPLPAKDAWMTVVVDGVRIRQGATTERLLSGRVAGPYRGPRYIGSATETKRACVGVE